MHTFSIFLFVIPFKLHYNVNIIEACISSSYKLLLKRAFNNLIESFETIIFPKVWRRNNHKRVKSFHDLTQKSSTEGLNRSTKAAAIKKKSYEAK